MKLNLDLNEKYREIIVDVKAPELNKEVITIMENLKNSTGINIIGKRNGKLYILDPNDLVCFYTKSNSIMVDSLEDTYEVKKKLYEIESELKNKGFVRISKFAIANVKKIKNIEMFFNGSLVVNFKNGKQEIISRRYVNRVKEYIGLGGQ